MTRLLAGLLISFFISSCGPSVQGNGKLETSVRFPGAFHSVNVSDALEVFLIPRLRDSLIIEGDENLHQYIETTVEDGVLYVSSTERIGRYQQLHISVGMQHLENLTASGAAEVTTRGVLKGEEIRLEFSGAVEAKLQLNCNELIGNFTGASELTLEGICNTVKLHGSGAAEIDALSFKTKKFTLELSGASEADVYVTEELNVDVSGATEIRYMGNPKIINKEVSGVADIKAI